MVCSDDEDDDDNNNNNNFLKALKYFDTLEQSLIFLKILCTVQAVLSSAVAIPALASKTPLHA